jgi:hypothetical protein
MGSRMYLGLGVRGGLKSIIDATASTASFPSVDLPIVPDIDGGAIYSLGNKSFTNQTMTNAGTQGQHRYNLSLTQL